MDNQQPITQTVEDMIGIIMRQTNLTEEESMNKLVEFNYNYIDVIKDWIKPNKPLPPVNHIIEPKYVNREIYKQIRHNLSKVVIPDKYK